MKCHSISLTLVVVALLLSSSILAEEGVFLSVGGDENISKVRSITPLVTSGNLLVVTNDDKCIRLRSSDDFSLIDEFRFEIGKGRIGEITSNLAITKGEEKFAFGRYGSRDVTSDIYVVQVSPKKILKRLTTKLHQHAITAVHFFDNNQKLASLDAGGQLVIWNLKTQKVENNLRMKSDEKISAISSERGGRFLVGTSSGKMLLLNPSPLKLLAKNKIGTARIMAGFWVSNAEFITIDVAGAIRKFNVNSNNIVKVRETALGSDSTIKTFAVDFAKKKILMFFGGRLVVSKKTDYSLRRFDFELKQIDQPKEFKKIGVQSAALLPKRQELIVSRSSGDLEKWSLDPLRKMHTIPSAAKYKLGVIFDPENPSPAGALELLWTVDPSLEEQTQININEVIKNSGFTLLGSEKKREFGMLNPQKFKRKIAFRSDFLKNARTATSDGKIYEGLGLMRKENSEPKRVYFVETTAGGSYKKTLKKWDIAPDMGIAVEFSALLSPRTALVTTGLGTYLMNPLTGKKIKELDWQLPGVNQISISPKRWFLSTYSQRDRSIVIWGLKDNPDRPKYLATLKVFGDDWALVSEDGFFECTSAAEKFIGWHVNEGPMKFASFHSLDKFSKDFNEPAYLESLLSSQDKRQAEILLRQLGKLQKRPTIKGSVGPEIAILSPTKTVIRQGTSRNLDVAVSFKEKNGEVPRAVSLLIQDRPANEHYHKLTAEDQASHEYQFKVKLAEGDQTIQAVVYPENSQNTYTSDRKITAGFHSVLGQKVPGRKLFFMGVGVKDYQDHGGLGYSDLNYCQSDVEAIGKVFRDVSKGAFIKPTEIKILKDPSSKDEFADQLEEMLKDENGQPEFSTTDTLIVMWSGHGDMTRGDRREFHLVLPDCEKPTDVSDRSLRKKGMSTFDMLADLKDIAGKGNVILILDTCYAGLFVQEFNDGRRNLTSKANDDEYGIMVISAADCDEESKESKELKMSNFAFLLRAGLLGIEQFKLNGQAETFSDPTAVRQLDAGRIVTTDSLVKFMKKNMPKLIEAQNLKPQTVRVNGGGNMNIFLAKLGENN